MNFNSLIPYSYCFFQFGLLLYAISPAVQHVSWMSGLVHLLFFATFVTGTVLTFRTLRRDKFQAMQILMGTSRERIYDIMISIVGLLICNTHGAHGMSILWGFILFSGIWGFFYPNPMNRR